MDDIEEWRDIPGREGCYQASSLGRVKSLPRSRTPGGILKEYNRSGYPSVTLSSPTTGGKIEADFEPFRGKASSFWGITEWTANHT